MGRLSELAGALHPGTSPTWQIRVNGLAAHDALSSRVISINVGLVAGMQSDQLTITLDDRPSVRSGGRIAIPKTGKDLEVLMGNTAGIASLGKYRVDQVTLSGSEAGNTMQIVGVPRLMLGETTRTFADKGLADIVDTIARENGLAARCSLAFQSASYKLAEEVQLRESDLSFLTRLAERYDAMVKPMAGHLLFLKKGEASTVGGTVLSAVELHPGNMFDWQCTPASDRSRYDAVVAVWHDFANATQDVVTAGASSSDDVFQLRQVFRNRRDAQMAADAKLKELKRTTSSLSVRTLGNPLLTAEGRVRVKNVRAGVDGAWIVQSVTHTFDQSGYICSLSAYQEE